MHVEPGGLELLARLSRDGEFLARVEVVPDGRSVEGHGRSEEGHGRSVEGQWKAMEGQRLV